MDLRLDRCVIEVAVRVLGRPVLHRVLTGPRWLWAARHRTVTYTATVVHADTDTVVLSAHGVVARQRFPRRVSVELAPELGA